MYDACNLRRSVINGKIAYFCSKECETLWRRDTAWFYNSMIIWTIVLPLVLAGDLAKLNCPSNFDMALENVTTSSQTDIITTMTPFYELIRGYGNSQIVETVVIQGNTASLQSHFLAMSYPFIAVAAIFLITYCIIISCCIFQKSCPPCQSWKRDFVRRPYEKS